MKILIIRFSSIGDIVLTTPVIRCLKLQLPHCDVHYVTKKAYYPILQHNPYLSKIHLLENSLSNTIADLRKEKFDVIIDLHNNLRSRQVKLALFKKSFSFKKLNIRKWFYTNFKLDTMPDIHIVDRYMDTVKSLGVINDGKGLDYFYGEEDGVDLSQYKLDLDTPYIALTIGAKFATKQMTMEKIVGICDTIHHPIILLGGENDVLKGREITKNSLNRRVVNLAGRLTINQSAYIVDKSKAVIAHDTGLMHVAAAFDKPIVSVWGNTTPKIGMSPYKPNEANKIVEVEGLKCRPCSKIGYQTCPKGHFKCMKDIKISDIVDAIEPVLN